MPPRIPDQAQDLIVRHIHSVAQLEVLLYLRSFGEGIATPESVGRDQKIGADMAADLLVDLSGRGFLSERDGGYVYDPQPALGRQVEALAEAYGTYRVAIINLIFSKPSEGVQSFADAFRLRKDED